VCNLDAVIVRVRDGDFVAGSSGDVERIVELVISTSLRSKPSDASMFAAKHTDRVVSRVTDHAVAVGADRHRARVKELAEAPLGQRHAGHCEHFESLL